MAGGTHGFDMIRRLRQNRSLGSIRHRKLDSSQFHPAAKNEDAGFVRVLRVAIKVIAVIGLTIGLIFLVGLLTN
jgi:hypothetical protein